MSQFEQIDDNSFSSPALTINSPRTNKKKNSRLWSKVWLDFKREEVSKDICWAHCNICKKKLTAKHTGGTSHLKSHANSCKRKQKEINNGKETEFEEVPKYEFRQVKSRKDLASMIILHEYPLSIVDHAGFRMFVGGFQPDFNIVSRNTIKKDIIKVYDVEREKTYKLLESVRRLSITFDIWSPKPTKKGFMAITAHFIDDKWRLQNRLLTFVYVAIPHNKQVLSNVVIETIDFWNIDRKISAITVDNATTNDAMIPLISTELPRDSFLMDGKLLHVRCCAHVLNLIVKEGLAAVGNKVEKIRVSCVFWTATQSRREKFEAAAAQLHIPYTRGLAAQLHIPYTRGLELDVKTRWNLTYYMLSRALLYKDVFRKAKKKDKSYDSLPSSDDWIFAEEICARLNFFADATVIFSGSSYPTANLFLKKMCEIKLELDKWLFSSNEIVVAMAFKMIEKYNKYWSDCHLIMSMASILDPRFKLKLVEFYFNKLYGVGVTSKHEFERIQESVYALFNDYKSKFDAANNDVTSSSGNYNMDVDEEDNLSGFDVFVNETTTRSESELDVYLREKLVSRKGKFDILNWWQSQKGFPILQMIAKDILVVQVSTVASESTFSTSGRLISPHRSRLHPTTLKALMCAQNWLSGELKDSDSSLDASCLPKVNDEEEEPIDEMEAGSSGTNDHVMI